MAANSQRLVKKRNDTLSSLNVSIKAMNHLAKEHSGIPIKGTFRTVSALLMIIRVCSLFCDDEFLIYIQPGPHG